MATPQRPAAWKVLAVFCGSGEDTGCGTVQEFLDLPGTEAEVGPQVQSTDSAQFMLPMTMTGQQHPHASALNFCASPSSLYHMVSIAFCCCLSSLQAIMQTFC